MNKMWKKIFILLSGYLSFIAYAIVGGYVFLKCEDEDLRKTAKLTLVLTLIFTGISALLLIYNQFGNFFSGQYGSAAYDVYSILSGVVAIVEVIVYAVFIILTVVKKDKKEEVVVEEEKTSE